MISDLTSILNVYLYLSLIFLYLFYKFATWTFTMEREFGYSGPKPLPLVGNLLGFLKDTHGWDIKNKKIYGSIYPIYMGRTGAFVVSDEAILKQILVKDAKSFNDRPPFQVQSKILKNGLLELNGHDWERVRALVTPAFTSAKLKNMLPIIDTVIKRVVGKISTLSHIDAKEIFSSLTMDVIAKTMFGIELDGAANTHNSFVEHAKKLFRFSLSTTLFIVADIFHLVGLIEYFFPKGVSCPRSMDFVEKCVIHTIKSRQNSNEVHNDFLDLLLKVHHEIENDIKTKDNKELISYGKLTEEEIIAQSIVFLLAGYETTASLLTFCSYYLAMNQDVQDELYQEILKNIPNGTKITYDVLSKLNLMDQCLNESLRICPPVPRITRQCTKDTTLTTSSGETFRIKKGLSFLIPTNAIHHDEQLWSDPDQFDIHRFDKDKRNLNQFSFMPFGVGPRMCVGMRFALLESKLALTNFLLEYRIIPCDDTPKTLIFESNILTALKEPVIIRIEKR